MPNKPLQATAKGAPRLSGKTFGSHQLLVPNLEM